MAAAAAAFSSLNAAASVAHLPVAAMRSKRPGAAAPCCARESLVSLLDDVHEHLRKSPDLRPIVTEKILEISRELLVKDADAEEDGALLELSPAERIKQGFLKFKAEKYMKKPRLYKKLADAQNPKFMVIACCDSRVCPTAILGLEPGEAFVARNIANMVPAWNEVGYPETRAALEFSVLQLKVEHILVIGHSRCGGIRALMTHEDNASRWSEFIQDWIEVGKRARSQTLDATAEQGVDKQCSHCERKSLSITLNNLLSFPWIKDAVDEGNLSLHGGYYDFVEGSFEFWDFDAQSKSCGPAVKFQ